MNRRRGYGPPRVSRAQIAEQHLTWLQALPGDGPFLTVPVLTEALPTGLEPTEPARAQRFKQTYAAYRSAPVAHRDAARDAFVTDTVTEVLDWHRHADTSSDAVAAHTHTVPGFGTTTTPAMVLWPCAAADAEASTKASMLLFAWPAGTGLHRRLLDGWAATPIDRAAAALRHFDIPVGIVTEGRWWAVVWAPRGSATGHVLFDTHAMLDDRQLLDAFTTLLSRRRFLAVAGEDTLPALLDRALDSQEDLTENLSEQVRKAVEMLVDAAGRADTASGGQALAGVGAEQVYDGAVTVVMRLVFLLAAEERRLLPGDDAFYAAHYSIAGLAERLIEQSQQVGQDVLARTSSAIPQILATTRLVHDGVRHQRLNIKGYGGSVFDPARHPWLEGAQPGGTGQPIHVDDRTLLHILTGLTRWQGRRLAYRTLDVEQIGYVYEGLLDHTAVNADTPTLGLGGKKEPEVTLATLEEHAARDPKQFTKWVKDATGLTPAQVTKALAQPLGEDPEARRQLLSACRGDTTLADRIAPYRGLVRTDERTGEPIVYRPGDWYVTASSARSDAGSYYTPRSLAEEVVTHALDPLLHDPGPLQTLDADQWRVVHPDQILDLSVADIAMGSGAFLVAADRYLADRLLQAVAAHDPATFTDPAVADLAALLATRGDQDPTQGDSDADEATVTARRLVATRCLYGVDINPMAVEMAKLSLWLATAAKDQPFGFLDHHLAAGDTLLGLTTAGQLESAHPDPVTGARIHKSSLFDQTALIGRALHQAVGERTAIERMRVHDIRDIEQQQALLADADRRLADLTLLADAITAQAFRAARDNNRNLDQYMLALGGDGGLLLDPDTPATEKDTVRERFRDMATAMDDARPEGAFPRDPLHWVLRFPEILTSNQGGFDAIIGNPPYLGGKKITPALGFDYRAYLVEDVAEGRRGNADLVVYFLLRACDLSTRRVGLITTNTVGQGDSREVGLDHLHCTRWDILRAVRSAPWPSKSASLEYAAVHLDHHFEEPARRVLDGEEVPRIGPDLRIGSRIDWTARRLLANTDIAFIGSFVNGTGFVLGLEDAEAMIAADPRNREVLFPYLNGDDLNSSPTQAASRWIVNFFDWEEEAARTYPLPFEKISRDVREERQAKSNKPHLGRFWWRYESRGVALYEAIAKFDTVLSIARVSNVVQPSRTGADQVQSEQVVVFASESPALLGLLSSGIHGEWVRKYASTMGAGAGIRYGPSDVFETFPFPVDLAALEFVGWAMESARNAVMADRTIGLTAAYNLVNDEACADADVAALREAHVELDRAVLAAYGWDDRDPAHGFFDTEQGVRFCMDRTATAEVLDRLLELNKERFETEVAVGLHGKAAPKAAARKRPDRGKGGDDDLSLFN